MKFLLNDFIKKRNITKEQAAKEIGISNPTLYKLCDGRAKVIRFDVLEKICDVFDCTPDDLFDRYQNEKTKPIPSTEEIETFKVNAHVSFGDLLADLLDSRIKTIAKQELNEEKDDTK